MRLSYEISLINQTTLRQKLFLNFDVSDLFKKKSFNYCLHFVGRRTDWNDSKNDREILRNCKYYLKHTKQRI